MASTVWITGGAKGIGAATVRRFALSGWQVAFTYHTSKPQAIQLASDLQAQGYRVLALQGDVSNPDIATAHAKTIVQTFGTIDALVCNAGIAEQLQFQDISLACWHHMMQHNLDTAFCAIQAVLPTFLAQKNGAIVTVSSVWGMHGASCESHYAASKAALIALSKSLAKELGPSGIRVNCVAPGVIDTDMNQHHSTDTLQTLAEETPLGRLGTPSEVAELLFFLANPSASFITGEVITVSGGF